MTSSHKLHYLLTILSLVVGISLFGAAAQSSSDSNLYLSEIWAEPKDNTPNEWWIFVTISINENHWENLEFYTLKITIGEQTHEMIPDLAYQNTNPDEKAFVASFSDLQPDTYQVMIQWNDGTVSKVWVDERIQLGGPSEENSVDLFHQIVPAVLMVTILAIIVIFPGQIKKVSKPVQSETAIPQEDS